MDEQKRKYRSYTEEFKLQALELLKSSGKNARQVERDLGITPGLACEMERSVSSDIQKKRNKLIWN